MGIYIGRSRSSYDSSPSYAPAPVHLPAGNPNPRNFKLIREVQFNNASVMEVMYPDCDNYEGRKILVFNQPLSFHAITSANRKQLDPHFSGNKLYISPFARFEPTKEGWEWAKRLAKTL